MKPILVSEANIPAILKLLNVVNGRAAQHVFTIPDILELVRIAEEILHKRILKKDMVGARYSARSGNSVANSYGGSRIGNEAVFERRANGWYLISLVRCRLSTYAGGETALFLTTAQDKAAVAAFRARYSILKTQLERPATPTQTPTAPAA